MTDGTENIFAQLEAAIAAWNARAGQAHHGVLQAIAESRARLSAVGRVLDVQRSVSPSLVTARAGIDALEQSPDERRKSMEEAVSSVAELSMYLGTFERALGNLLEQANSTVQAGDQLMDQLLALRGEGAVVLAHGMDDYTSDPGSMPLTGAHEAKLQERVSALRNELAEVRQEYADIMRREEEAQAAAQKELNGLRAENDRIRAEIRSARSDTPTRAKAPEAHPFATTPPPGGRYSRILASAHDDRGVKRPMGKILVEAGVITQDQLDEALLAKQMAGNRHLGGILVDRGYTTHSTIAQILSAQANVPFIHLRESNIDPRAIRVVTPQLARRHTCVPFHVDGEVLSVAMSNPLDLVALDDLQLAVRQRLQPYAAATDEIEDAIRRHYRQP